MTDDGLVNGSDGLLARKSGPWALEKLSRVERYAGAVTTAIRNKFTCGLTFVDLMAGPGMCVDTVSDHALQFASSLGCLVVRPAAESSTASTKALDTRRLETKQNSS
jgi:hypothetical protein